MFSLASSYHQTCSTSNFWRNHPNSKCDALGILTIWCNSAYSTWIIKELNAHKYFSFFLIVTMARLQESRFVAIATTAVNQWRCSSLPVNVNEVEWSFIPLHQMTTTLTTSLFVYVSYFESYALIGSPKIAGNQGKRLLWVTCQWDVADVFAFDALFATFCLLFLVLPIFACTIFFNHQGGSKVCSNCWWW